MGYKVELVEKKYSFKLLEASKSSIKDLFSDMLNESKRFKYQITLKFRLKKYKSNEEIEFRSFYLNSTIKIVINYKFILEDLFKKFCTELITGLMKDLDWLLN